jgi:hypothetical protein
VQDDEAAAKNRQTQRRMTRNDLCLDDRSLSYHDRATSATKGLFDRSSWQYVEQMQSSPVHSGLMELYPTRLERRIGLIYYK